MPQPVTDFISNLVALVLLGVGIFLHTKGITLNGQQEAAASQLLGGLFDSIAGLIIYVRQQHKSVMKALQKHSDDPMAHFVQDQPAVNPPKESSVKKILPVLLALVGLVSLSGCVAQSGGNPSTQPSTITPAQVLAAANQTIATTETILNDLHAAGVFSQTDWSHIVSVEAGLGAALDAWQQNLGQPGAAQAQAAFEAALPDLLSLINSGQKTAAAKALVKKGG